MALSRLFGSRVFALVVGSRVFALALSLLPCVHARVAHANGAFPDSLGILLPQDRPDQILAATNFGLLRSDDGGASFYLICEDVVGTLASLYQVGPPPDDRMYSVTVDGLAHSSDGACSWKFASGFRGDVSDVFPDPSDPRHVLAIGKADPTESGAPRQAVFESHDAGASFASQPFYFGPGSAQLTGVEIAKSAPGTIYVAIFVYAPPPLRAFLVRSVDAGASFEMIDLSSRIGTMLPRILAVDPEDANKLYLRLYDNGVEEQLAVYDAERDELTVGLHVQDRMSAFLRRSDGALIVAAKSGGAFISDDGGRSFRDFPHVPHLRALGERDGTLYAVADDKLDGYAVGVSHDQGTSWEALVRFKDLRGPLACGDVAERCAIPWENLQNALAMPGDPDMLPGDLDASPEKDAGKPHVRKSSGCGCGVLATRQTLAGPLFAVCTLVWLARRVMTTSRRRGAEPERPCNSCSATLHRRSR